LTISEHLLSHSLNSETHLHITTNNHTLIHRMTLALLRNRTSFLTFFAHTLHRFLAAHIHTHTGFLHTHTLLSQVACLILFSSLPLMWKSEEASITNQPIGGAFRAQGISNEVRPLASQDLKSCTTQQVFYLGGNMRSFHSCLMPFGHNLVTNFPLPCVKVLSCTLQI
jgi:hypothetical protein